MFSVRANSVDTTPEVRVDTRTAVTVSDPGRSDQAPLPFVSRGSPAASSGQQRPRVLTGVKVLRFAPTPLRGASAWTPSSRTLVQIGP